MDEARRISSNPIQLSSLSNWQPRFEKISIPTISLPIPDDVLQYLRTDFFVLPKECDDQDQDDTDAFGDSSEAAYQAADDDYDDEDDATDLEPPTFPAFSDAMRAAIATHGGGVFIKTNWNSPKDAFWITTGQTLRCRDISDIYQLLKASSFCKEDLAVDGDIVRPFLHLRKWMEIHPGTEFRCYVRNGGLIGS